MGDRGGPADCSHPTSAILALLPSPVPRSPRIVRILAGVLLALFIASGLMVARRLVLPAAAAAPAAEGSATRPDVAGLLHLPSFSLVDQDGRAFTRDDLLGHVSVLDVFFTSCPLVCPMMTEKMHAMAESLADTPVRFVSISIDPAHDTPAAIREYRKVHEITGNAADRWAHLTSPDGSTAYIDPIVREGLKCAVDEDPNLKIKATDGSEMLNLLHPAWFFLIDARDGKAVNVVGLYQSGNDEDMLRLLRDARALAK